MHGECIQTCSYDLGRFHRSWHITMVDGLRCELAVESGKPSASALRLTTPERCQLAKSDVLLVSDVLSMANQKENSTSHALPTLH